MNQSCFSPLVNGFGTVAIIYGGHFSGGEGVKGDGLSLYVLNSGTVEVRSGIFTGDMKVERRGTIEFYGCFKREGNRVKGLFASDDSELDVNVRTYYGGEIKLISVSGDEWTILLNYLLCH